jgi:hypothetical protein
MIDAQMIDRIGWTLLHSTWQLTLIAGAAAALNRTLFRRSAELKYGGGCVALLAMVAATLATFAMQSATTAATPVLNPGRQSAEKDNLQQGLGLPHREPSAPFPIETDASRRGDHVCI